MASTWKSSLRDSIYKPIYNKTTTPAKKKSEPEGKKINKKKAPKTKTKTKKISQKKLDPPRLRRTPGRVSLATWVARAPGHTSSFSLSLIWSDSFSLSLWSGMIWSPSLWSDLTLSLSLILFLKFFWFINQVLETRFSSGHHVEKDVTSDVIRPWKSSLKDSIYRPKSSLLDSSC